MHSQRQPRILRDRQQWSIKARDLGTGRTLGARNGWSLSVHFRWSHGYRKLQLSTSCVSAVFIWFGCSLTSPRARGTNFGRSRQGKGALDLVPLEIRTGSSEKNVNQQNSVRAFVTLTSLDCTITLMFSWERYPPDQRHARRPNPRSSRTLAVFVSTLIEMANPRFSVA